LTAPAVNILVFVQKLYYKKVVQIQKLTIGMDSYSVCLYPTVIHLTAFVVAQLLLMLVLMTT